jgi:hypothetical protein
MRCYLQKTIALRACAKLERQAGQVQALAGSRAQHRREAEARREARIAEISAQPPDQPDLVRAHAAQATDPEVISRQRERFSSTRSATWSL